MSRIEYKCEELLCELLLCYAAITFNQELGYLGFGRTGRCNFITPVAYRPSDQIAIGEGAVKRRVSAIKVVGFTVVGLEAIDVTDIPLINFRQAILVVPVSFRAKIGTSGAGIGKGF